jgi:hypothetical protein
MSEMQIVISMFFYTSIAKFFIESMFPEKKSDV